MRRIDLRRSLQDLEHDDWGEPSVPTAPMTVGHALRRKPSAAFTPADLRIMIGQQISLPFLAPLALDLLEKNPFVEGNFYPGDLLRAVVACGDAFLERSS